uniref:VPS8 subunit of CORVET complex n=1 Tax=Zonotrichia albicollis TaxID=44394 RepID=A0A8D2MSR3_ZONAL
EARVAGSSPAGAGPAMAAALEPAEAEPCPEPPAHRLSVAELDRELDSRSELIDDKEFDIPQVDTPPTLESILNETDDEEESFILEDPFLLNLDNTDTHSYDTSSVASSDSGDRTHLKRKKKLPDSLSLHGSVIRLSLLKGISAQIVSAAVSAASNLIAVGTSHGLALIFDQNQALRLCLGSTAVGAQYGAISALSINNDCSRLLCGFAKGQITMWDLASGKLLRSITDAHPPGTAILHIKFTDDPTLAICNDSGGIVQFEESRLIQMAEKAEFYQICEFMYERQLRYDKIIGCYLRDPLRKEEVFNYIHNILSMPGYSAEEKQLVWQKALDHIEELLVLSPGKAADLAAIHFSEQLESIISNLQDQFLLFQFLRSLLDPRYVESWTVYKLQCANVDSNQFFEPVHQ